MLKINPGLQIVLFVLLLAPVCAWAAETARGDLINIKADEAFEDVQPGTLYFKGHFLMQSREWRLESAQATVFGPPDEPDRVILEGDPASFVITRHEGEREMEVEARAPVMEYLRSTRTLELTGGATLRQDSESISSAVIRYNIDTRRFWSGGADGVLIEVQPAPDNSVGGAR